MARLKTTTAKLKAKLATCRNLWRDKAKRWLVKPHPQAEKGKLTPAQWAMTLPCVIAYIALLLAIIEAGWVGGFTTAAIVGATAIGLWLWGWAMAWQDKRETKQSHSSRAG